MKKNKKGFTLVELVIVIAVIAILSVVLIPTLSGVIGDARKAQAQSACSNAVTQYVTENSGSAPSDGMVFVSNGYHFEFDADAATAGDQLVFKSDMRIAEISPATDPKTYEDANNESSPTYQVYVFTNAVANVTVYFPSLT